MGLVLRMVQHSAKETVEALGALLARASRGEIRGIALCFRLASGREKTVFTGCYKSTSAAASAAMRISWQMTLADESAFMPPPS